MEELKIIKITKDNSTGNKKLDTCINKINTEFSRGIKASHEIARQLQKIRDEELYTTTGAESFSEFSEKWFNISRSQASRLASISEKFLHEKMIDADTGKEIYTYEEYTTSKLVEMLKATDEQLEMITSDMTVKEIRDFISGKAIEDNNDDSDNTDDGGSDDSDNYEFVARTDIKQEIGTMLGDLFNRFADTRDNMTADNYMTLYNQLFDKYVKTYEDIMAKL